MLGGVGVVVVVGGGSSLSIASEPSSQRPNWILQSFNKDVFHLGCYSAILNFKQGQMLFLTEMMTSLLKNGGENRRKIPKQYRYKTTLTVSFPKVNTQASHSEAAA